MNTKSIFFAALVVGLSILGGCKKDENNPASGGQSSSLIGKWQVTSGDPAVKYFIFNTDNTWYGLKEANYGLRSLESGVSQVTSTQINFRGSVYNYSITGNELRITSTTETLVCTKNDAAPETAQWVGAITKLDSLVAPNDQLTDIAANGTSLWYGNGYSNVRKLYRINTSTKSSAMIPPTNVDFTEYAFAVEYANSYLWCGSNGGRNLYKIDPNTGAVLTTSLDLGPWLNGIAFDGQYLWAASSNNSAIYKYNPATNSIAGSYTDIRVEGMAFVGTTLYICKDGVINKCTSSPLRATNAYQIPGVYIGGIAHDGTNFWISTRVGNYPNATYMIYKVNL